MELGHAVSLCSAGPRPNHLCLGLVVMHIASAFVIFHDIHFLSVKRASANAILCFKTAWGL